MNGVVLYIDDNQDNILLVQRLLKRRCPDVQLHTAMTAAVPVVILSGDSNPATVNELLAAGAAEFLAKPFDIHQLLAVIGRYLGE